MTSHDYTITFRTEQTPETVFEAICNVPAWWSEAFRGNAARPGDEFEVRFFGDVHYSRHRLTEAVPGQKITWLVTDSSLNFVQDKSEWTGTTNSFEIIPSGSGTELRFTHQGLTPQLECFKNCNSGWNQYLQSLLQLINTGTGAPYRP